MVIPGVEVAYGMKNITVFARNAAPALAEAQAKNPDWVVISRNEGQQGPQERGLPDGAEEEVIRATLREAVTVIQAAPQGPGVDSQVCLPFPHPRFPARRQR